MVRFKIRRGDRTNQRDLPHQDGKMPRQGGGNAGGREKKTSSTTATATGAGIGLTTTDRMDVDTSCGGVGGAERSSIGNGPTMDSIKSKEQPSPYQMLSYDWILRLHDVLQTELLISPHSDYQHMPELKMNLRQLILSIKKRLEAEGVTIKDIRLNGGATCYVLGEEDAKDFDYSDIDLLFGVDLSNGSSYNQIKSIFLNALTAFMVDYKGDKENLSEPFLKDCYVKKMVLVNGPNGDYWSLFSLGNAKKGEKVVEMKFVLRMRRQFEFTVDSFQIILDSMLSFYEKSERPMDRHFYPPVVVESVSGNFEEALFHLRNRLIATRNPEEIRGGGLLKYCKLLVEGYVPIDSHSIHILERYMCSRFFIDFPELYKQYRMLSSYLRNHFNKKENLKVSYLQTLRRVVDKSTVCLMFYDRRQTIQLINCFIEKVLHEDDSLSDVDGFEMISSTKHKYKAIQLEEFNSHHWSLDQVFYGTSYFPQEAYIQYALPPAIINTGFMDTTPMSTGEMEGGVSLASITDSCSPNEYIISIGENDNGLQTSTALFMTGPLLMGPEPGPAVMGFWSLQPPALGTTNYSQMMCMSQESSPSLPEEAATNNRLCFGEAEL